MSCIFLCTCTLSSPQLSLSLSDVPFLPFSFTSHPLHGLLPHGPSICQTFFHFCSFSLSSFSLLILYPHSLSLSLLILSPHSLSSFSLLILSLSPHSLSSFSLLILSPHSLSLSSFSILILYPHSLSSFSLLFILSPHSLSSFSLLILSLFSSFSLLILSLSLLILSPHSLSSFSLLILSLLIYFPSPSLPPSLSSPSSLTAPIVTLDEKCWLMYTTLSMNLCQSVSFIYPKMMALVSGSVLWN